MKTKSASCRPCEGKRTSGLRSGILFLTLLVMLSIISCTNRRYGYLTTRVKAKKYHSENVVKQRKSPPRETRHAFTFSAADPADRLQPEIGTESGIRNSDIAQQHTVPAERNDLLFRSGTQDVQFKQHKTKSNQLRQKSEALSADIARAEKERTRLTKAYFNQVFLTVTGGILSTLLVFVLLFRKRSRSLSKWASAHTVKARVLLIAGRTVLGVSGFLAGTWMQRNGFTVSDASVWVLGGLSALSVVLYPVRKVSKGPWKAGFIQRKVHDLVLLVAGTALMFGLGNIASQRRQVDPGHNTLQHVYAVALHNPGQDTENATCITGEQQLWSDGDLHDDVKTLLSVLAVIVYGIIFYLTAMLACELSCSGQEGLAFLVASLGWVGGLLLLIYILRAMWRK